MSIFQGAQEEAQNLHTEYKWILQNEVHSVLKQLYDVLMDCANRFPVPLYENKYKKQEKIVLTNSSDNIRCTMTISGDYITQADIKIQRPNNVVQRTSITPDFPWKLQQIQDSANHLQQAIQYITDIDKTYVFKASEEVLYRITTISDTLKRCKMALILPQKNGIEELLKAKNKNNLTPNLPEDLAINFFFQNHKLVFVVYQLMKSRSALKFDSFQAGISITWLNDILVFLTVALQICQQLKHKILIFKQYKDFNILSNSYTSSY